MFSRRLSWSFSPNRLTHLLEEKRRADSEILDLTESNPTRAGFDYPSDAILASLKDPRALVYEPAPLGLPTAREAVAGYYARRGQIVSPEHLALTASTSEAYSFLFKVLCDPGDRVLLPRPSYPLFDYLASLESVETDSYSLVYDGSWSIDLETIRSKLGPRTRALLLVHPNNPTGSYVKQAELTALTTMCGEHDVALIVDEVFADYGFGEDLDRSPTFVGKNDVLTFVLSGLSKIAALPQMKLAWIWTGGPEDKKRDTLARLEQVGDVFLSVGAQAQHAAAKLLDLAPSLQTAIRERLVENRELLRNAIPTSSPLEARPVEGGWYAVLRCPEVQSSEEWAFAFLSFDDTHVHPGYLFDFPTDAYLVVSLLTPTKIFERGIRRMLSRVETTVAAI
jgi:aspartate/methionine/tyrosine aminotransferase